MSSLARLGLPFFITPCCFSSTLPISLHHHHQIFNPPPHHTDTRRRPKNDGHVHVVYTPSHPPPINQASTSHYPLLPTTITSSNTDPRAKSHRGFAPPCPLWAWPVLPVPFVPSFHSFLVRSFASQPASEGHPWGKRFEQVTKPTVLLSSPVNCPAAQSSSLLLGRQGILDAHGRRSPNPLPTSIQLGKGSLPAFNFTPEPTSRQYQSEHQH
jgi:hypothetical protein